VSGWYAVQRGITAHHLFERKPERLAVWMWLMDNAAWKDTTHDVKGHTVVVPRGSVCVSERHIADKCGVGYQVVRTAIKRFASEQMLNATPTHGKSLITLCNYGKYQDVNKDANAAPNATPTQRQRNPNAQKKQGNKVTKKVDKSTSSQEAADYQKYLDAHPKSVESQSGEDAFSKLVSNGVDASQIISSAAAYAETVKGWSAQGKVQQSDNFLDTERGKWKEYIPKPKAAPASEDDIMKFWANSINEGRYISASSITAVRGRAMVEGGYVTEAQLSEKGIKI
jgi:hypothetical protein